MTWEVRNDEGVRNDAGAQMEYAPFAKRKGARASEARSRGMRCRSELGRTSPLTPLRFAKGGDSSLRSE